MNTIIKLKGVNGEAKVFTDLLEDTAREQIEGMMDSEITEGTQVRIMPDCHAGKGSTIGTTIKLAEDFADWKVCPNVVGLDVGCGILMYKLGAKDVDLEDLDNKVNHAIPTGFSVHQNPQNKTYTDKLLESITVPGIDGRVAERIGQSLGTLGGGNHFIELGKDETGAYWLSVHSGSRNLGVQVAKYHQDVAIKNLEDSAFDIEGMVEQLKIEGRHKEIQQAIKDANKNAPVISTDSKTLAYLVGEDLKNYLHDMALAQDYAHMNRKTMLDLIVEVMGFNVVDQFDSVHNFIEHDNFTNGVIRKGATSAKTGERLVIPLNMRDGSLICRGRGNADWNESAPHGAGRMMSRAQARKDIDLETFQAQMSDIYSTSVMEATLDEAPDAYKPAESILQNIKPTADVIHIVKPVWNFKAH